MTTTTNNDGGDSETNSNNTTTYNYYYGSEGPSSATVTVPGDTPMARIQRLLTLRIQMGHYYQSRSMTRLLRLRPDKGTLPNGDALHRFFLMYGFIEHHCAQ